jgi:uncharacterized protein YcbX
MPISLISASTVRELSGRVGTDLDVRRFRPNFVIESVGEKAFPEDRWLGDELLLGDHENPARVRINRKDPRCMVIGLDPDTGEHNPSVLKEVVRSRKNLVGVYASVERPGVVHVGDVVRRVKR